MRTSKLPNVQPASLDRIETLLPLDIRIPKWDADKMENRDCPFCRSRDSPTRYIRPDGLSVKRCLTCRTLFVSPAPNSDALESFYYSYHTQHFQVSSEKPDDILMALDHANPLSDIRIKVMSSIIDIGMSRVLDVGCGKASFIYQLKRLGADVVGIEIDKDAVSFGNKLGIQSIHNGTIESYEDNSGFDLIVLNDLIEHPLDPLALLRKSLRLLNKNGVLLVWTPNGDQPEADVEKITLRKDLEHLQYLGSGTICYITKILPLELIHYETTGYPGLVGVIKEISPAKKLIMSAVKNLARQIPGFLLADKLRKTMINDKDRLGNYSLFCMLRKVV